jgi:hypothetical protein
MESRTTVERDSHPAQSQGFFIFQSKIIVRKTPQDIVKFGKYAGSSLADIYRFDPKYLQWCIKNIEGFRLDITLFEELPKPTSIGQNVWRIHKTIKNKINEEDFADLIDKTTLNPLFIILDSRLDGGFKYIKLKRSERSKYKIDMAMMDVYIFSNIHARMDFPISYFMNHPLYEEAVAIMEESDFSFTEEDRGKCELNE